MGNVNSSNKAARVAADRKAKNGGGQCWANDLELLATMREELKFQQQHEHHQVVGGRRSHHQHHHKSQSRRRSTTRTSKPDQLSLDEIRQLHYLVQQLSQEKEGKDLLKQFVEKQADLGMDPSIPPLPTILVPQKQEQSKGNSKGSRAA